MADQTSSCRGVPCSRNSSVPRRVRDHRLDLATVTDDPCVAEQTFDVTLAVTSDLVGIEVREGLAEVSRLRRIGVPREARLEALEAEPLEDVALVRTGRPHSSSW